MVDLRVLDNGNLRIEWNDSDQYSKHNKKFIREQRQLYGSDVVLHEMLEDWLGNGWGLYAADKLGQLSTAPVICEDSSIDDNGNVILSGRAWYFGNYMIVDEVAEILEKGFVDFDLWQHFDKPQAFTSPCGVMQK